MFRASVVLIVIVPAALGGLCRAADGPGPKQIAAGDWSKPVADTRGFAVRGRLVLYEKRLSDDRREVTVYVELQDATESVGRSMRLYCEMAKTDFRPEYKGGLQCELQDKNKKSVKTTPFPFSGA